MASWSGSAESEEFAQDESRFSFDSRDFNEQEGNLSDISANAVYSGSDDDGIEEKRFETKEEADFDRERPENEPHELFTGQKTSMLTKFKKDLPKKWIVFTQNNLTSFEGLNKELNYFFSAGMRFFVEKQTVDENLFWEYCMQNVVDFELLQHHLRLAGSAKSGKRKAGAAGLDIVLKHVKFIQSTDARVGVSQHDMAISSAESQEDSDGHVRPHSPVNQIGIILHKALVDEPRFSQLCSRLKRIGSITAIIVHKCAFKIPPGSLCNVLKAGQGLLRQVVITSNTFTHPVLSCCSVCWRWDNEITAKTLESLVYLVVDSTVLFNLFDQMDFKREKLAKLKFALFLGSQVIRQSRSSSSSSSSSGSQTKIGQLFESLDTLLWEKCLVTTLNDQDIQMPENALNNGKVEAAEWLDRTHGTLLFGSDKRVNYSVVGKENLPERSCVPLHITSPREQKLRLSATKFGRSDSVASIKVDEPVDPDFITPKNRSRRNSSVGDGKGISPLNLIHELQDSPRVRRFSSPSPRSFSGKALTPSRQRKKSKSRGKKQRRS